MKTCTQKQAKAAAQWWREHLGQPALDAGDRSAEGVVAVMMCRNQQKPVTKAQADMFEFKLAVSIERMDVDQVLTCDYDADEILQAALTWAAVESMNPLPWKTRMRFNADGSIKVRNGYGAPWVEILAPDAATGGGALNAALRP